MGIFSSILDKIRHHRHADTANSSTPSANRTSTQSAQASTQSAPQTTNPAMNSRTGSATTSAASQPALQNVDIDAVLSDLASRKGGGGNYRQSIVDLLKLLDLDSSLAARKELAEELNVCAGAHGSAEQNIALHRAVIKKLEENGGKVPETMRS